MSKIKPILIWLVALAIPGGLIGGFFYSQQQAEKELAAYNKMQKEHPAETKITVDNYHLKEVDGKNVTKWQLVARQGTMEPSSRDVTLADVNVQYFDGPKLKMSLSAPAGMCNEGTKVIKLESANGKLVEAHGEDGGAAMKAPKVELKNKSQFVATGGVTIVYPGVAKVTGSTVTGQLDKSADLKNFKIVGGTHALIGSIGGAM